MNPCKQLIFIFVTFSIDQALTDSPPEVSIGGGVLVGRFWQTRGNRTVEGYLGIRYAKPPLGDLRFEPPQPAEPWSGVRMADKMPPVCLQRHPTFGPDSEDCLYLNVFTTNVKTRPLMPVLVSVYGGGYENAGISSFTPEYLLDGDIVLVPIQYRGGLFGFLSTNDGVMPGNQGLKDVRLGLRWVQDHIHHFGGDPRKVTIMGNSAGGVLVHALMLFSAHEGLFRAGITLSGFTLMASGLKAPRHVTNMIPVLAEMSSCPSDSAGLVQCLKLKPARELIQLWEGYKKKTFNAVTSQFISTLGPVVEPECVQDRIITDNPWNKSVTIPWLVGVNGLEGAFWLYDLLMDQSNILFSLTNTYLGYVLDHWMNYDNSDVDFRGVPEAVRSFYFNNRSISRETYLQLTEVISDAFILYASYESILRGNLGRTYVYVNEYVGEQFVHKAHVPRKYILGPDHSADHRTYLFPDPVAAVPDRIDSAEDEIVSKRVIKLTTNFITNLKPTSSGDDIEWSSFGSEERYLNLTLDSFHMNRGFFTERMRFWQNQPFPIRDETIGPLLCS